MPAFAGFNDLRDYLKRRCREYPPDGLSLAELSDRLGKGKAYMSGVATGRFLPSLDMADELAQFFGDNPRIVRILCGLELPPTGGKHVADITEIAASLPPAGRQELLEYAQFLHKKYAEKKAAASS